MQTHKNERLNYVASYVVSFAYYVGVVSCAKWKFAGNAVFNSSKKNVENNKMQEGKNRDHAIEWTAIEKFSILRWCYCWCNASLLSSTLAIKIDNVDVNHSNTNRFSWWDLYGVKPSVILSMAHTFRTIFSIFFFASTFHFNCINVHSFIFQVSIFVYTLNEFILNFKYEFYITCTLLNSVPSLQYHSVCICITQESWVSKFIHLFDTRRKRRTCQVHLM